MPEREHFDVEENATGRSSYRQAYECACGSPKFEILSDGSVQCKRCNKIARDLKAWGT